MRFSESDKVDELVNPNFGNSTLMSKLVLTLASNSLYKNFRRTARQNTTRAALEFPILARKYQEAQKYVDPAWASILRYVPNLDHFFEQYTDPNFVDDGTQYFDFESILTTVSSMYSELAKFCLWKDKNCLKQEQWSRISTRIGVCWELKIPDREIQLTNEKLRLVFGKYFKT
ncbi:uncharacterized protein LOC142358369, partial [Convolutriloba macropyga]|uniref:uncharacterized protein LOC142358369 n=1 Tax=Convolutriloba macropyga TaxID=536237 RepID=UPI003F51F359